MIPRSCSPFTECYSQVEDTNPSVTFTGQLTDVSAVEKFELSEEQYAQRQGKARRRFRHFVD